MSFSPGRSACRRLAGSVLALVGLTALTATGQTLTQLTSVAAGANINQSSVTANVTARYQSAGNFRDLTQTFIWNSDGAITGIGLLIDAGSGGSGTTFTSTSQTFALDLQQLTSATVRTVTSTLTTLNFTLTSSLVTANDYLYISFDTPVALTNGGAYAFNLRPTSIVASNALDISDSTTANTTLYGVGAQGSTAGLVSTYGNGNIDLTYFTTATAVPEPPSFALLAAAGGGLFFLRRSLIRNCR